MTCFFCKDNMEDSITTHCTDIGSCIVVIKNVPCRVCTQCGAIAYMLDVGKKLEQIISATKNTLSEVSIINYSNAAA